MEGTIDGVPFEFWHDTSENFDFENAGGIVVSGSEVNVVVQFDWPPMEMEMELLKFIQIQKMVPTTVILQINLKIISKLQQT
jgi:hypothetical protein